jgi:hypothetical protein
MSANNIVPDEAAHQIGVEICEAAGAGRPDHPALRRDIERAAFVALHSATFRALIATAAALRHMDVPDPKP